MSHKAILIVVVVLVAAGIYYYISNKSTTTTSGSGTGDGSAADGGTPKPAAPVVQVMGTRTGPGVAVRPNDGGTYEYDATTKLYYPATPPPANGNYGPRTATTHPSGASTSAVSIATPVVSAAATAPASSSVLSHWFHTT